MRYPRSVLIIEDEEILARNLQEYLARDGWAVRVVHTGMEAQEAALECSPDVILFDYHLPDMDGFRSLDAVRARHLCPCVLMTGHPADVVGPKVQEHGIYQVVYKPFSMAALELVLLGAIAGGPKPKNTPPPGA